MFSRVATLFTILFFVMFAAANVVRRDNPHNPPPSDQCTTGNTYCCNSVTDGSDPTAVTAAGLAGIVGTVTGTVGLTCNPIGGGSCDKQTVCCTGNNYSGIIVIGCSPIIINA